MVVKEKPKRVRAKRVKKEDSAGASKVSCRRVVDFVRFAPADFRSFRPRRLVDPLPRSSPTSHNHCSPRSPSTINPTPTSTETKELRLRPHRRRPFQPLLLLSTSRSTSRNGRRFLGGRRTLCFRRREKGRVRLGFGTGVRWDGCGDGRRGGRRKWWRREGREEKSDEAQGLGG